MNLAHGRTASANLTRGAALDQPTLPLPDVPLIIEDLLVQAKALADAGASTDLVEELLDQVAALRAGRS